MKKCIVLAALALTLLSIPLSSASAGTFRRSYCRPVYRHTHYAPRVRVVPTCVTPPVCVQPVVIRPSIAYPACVPVR
jgi:hypothetical protein